MIYDIGRPGEPPRLQINSPWEVDAQRQCQNGEVATLTGAPAPLAAPDWRSIRFGLLNACDWTMVSDSPLSAAARDAWRAYRQQLRDLADPDPVFPAPPEA